MNKRDKMTDLKSAAEDWCSNIFPEQLFDQDVFVEEIYPHEIRSYANSAFIAGYRAAIAEAAKVADKQWANFESGAGKWACEDIARQIKQLWEGSNE